MLIIKRLFACSAEKRIFMCEKTRGIFAGLRKISTFATANAEIAQLVEHNLAKVGVASSSLVFRSVFIVFFIRMTIMPRWRNW